MTALAKEVKQKALQLGPDERVELAETLLASVDEFATPEIEAAWRAEVGRRVDEIESGGAQLVSAADVHRKVRAAIDEVRRLPRGR